MIDQEQSAEWKKIDEEIKRFEKKTNREMFLAAAFLGGIAILTAGAMVLKFSQDSKPETAIEQGIKAKKISFLEGGYKKAQVVTGNRRILRIQAVQSKDKPGLCL